MKVLGAKIRWSLGWANKPSLKLLVDHLPPMDKFRFAFVQRGKGADHGLYWSELEGYVRILSYRGPSDGFAGRTFNITLADGTPKALKGPWDCGAAYANRYFAHSIGVAITSDPKVWKKGYTFYAAYVLASVASQAIDQFRPHAELVRGTAPAGEGMTSGDQNLVISHGLKPYGGLAPAYVIRCRDGRDKPSLTEAKAWNDIPGATGAFMELAEAGLDTLEKQAEFRQWFSEFRKTYEDKSGFISHRKWAEVWQNGIETYCKLALPASLGD